MAGQQAIERLQDRVGELARAGHDTERFAERLVEVLHAAVPHAAACVVTTDPATRLLTGSYKFGGLAELHDLDVEWARLEYGTDDPTRMIAIAQEQVPARAVSHLSGGADGSVRMRTLVRPTGFHDELRMVARQGEEVWGGVNLFRSVDEPHFDRSEVSALAALSETVAEGLRAGLVARFASGAGQASANCPAVLIVGADGDLRQMSVGSTGLFDEVVLDSNRSPVDSLVHSLAAAARGYAEGSGAPLPRARLRSPSGRWLVGHAAPLASHHGVTGEVVVTLDEARPPEIMSLLAAAFALSTREREVTQLVLGGSNTKAIAAELSMSSYTVQDHLKSIFEKADVRSRGELVARVFFDQYAPRFGDEVSHTGWFADPAPDHVGAPGDPAPARPVILSGETPTPRAHGSNGKQVGSVLRTGLLEGARTTVASGVGVLFVGEPGVGKTRLLDATLDLLSAEGWFTERFVASEASRGLPFGPLLSLLPSAAADPAGQVEAVLEALAERSGGRPVAIAIDDAHLLDEASLGCMAELVHHSDVVVLATARSTSPMPTELTSLWAGEALVRVDVEPLDMADTVEMARVLLGAEVGSQLAAQLWERTRGVPLFVRELLLDASAQRLLLQTDGVCELSGPLRPGARVQELVAARLGHLDASSRSVVELLAVADPVAIDLLDEHEREELDRLEEHRLARSERVAGRWVARVDHPLVAEAVSAELPTQRRLRLLSDAAARVIAAGCPAPGDALRAAAWLDECSKPIPAHVALSAGRESLAALALDRTCELAEAVLDELPGEGHLLLGEALRLQGRAAEAERALAVMADLAEDDDTIVKVAMWRSTLRAHHAADPEGAMGLLDAAADRVSSPERALELRSEAAFLAGILGRLDVSVETNRQILASHALDAPTRWTALMNMLFGQVMLADLTGIEEPIETMATMLDSVAPNRPEGVDLYRALEAAAKALSGDLVGCEAEFVAHVERCVEAEKLHGITAAILVQPLLYRGSQDAVAMARAACKDMSRSDPFLAGPIANAGLTLALTQAGDLDRARMALAEIDPTPTGDHRLDGFTGRAAAAVLALEGKRDEAAETAGEVGRRCIAGTYVQLGMLALYDAVRFGRADLVVDDMRLHGARTVAPLMDAMVDHATACAERDVSGLTKAAQVFAGMGARTLVADVLDDAVSVSTDDVVAARAATSAAIWRRATPAADELALPAAPPFDDRELEVIHAAASGLTSRAIAERMFTSARSVDERLSRAYGLLGIRGRSELATAIAPLPAAALVT